MDKLQRTWKHLHIRNITF